MSRMSWIEQLTAVVYGKRTRNSAGWIARGDRSEGQRVHGSRSKNGLAARALFEVLEDRTLLSWTPQVPTALPPQYHLFNSGGYLSGPSSDDPVTIAKNYLVAHAGEVGLVPADLDRFFVTTNYGPDSSGLTHLTLQQSVQGMEVAGANFNVNLFRDGRILNVGGGFVPGLAGLAIQKAPTPGMTAAEAVRRAAAALGLTLTDTPTEIQTGAAAGGATTLRATSVSLDDITARLQYVPEISDEIQVGLAWNLVLRTPDGAHWYNVSVDTTSGDMVRMVDYADDATYQVYAKPLENPLDGSRTSVVDPHIFSPTPSPVPSPFGWHDIDGAPGAEFTDTQGNNVSAQEDRDGNNTGGSRPNGGSSLNFSFPLDLTQQPDTYQNAAVTNLFYWSNILHDVHYLYGFDEAARNFQMNNYGRGGVGNDPVQADAQDGSGFNNANFFTPPDGTAPRMQMFEFTNTSPRRDSDLENTIIIHEYGHGVSNRLTGNGNGLYTVQSAGMGEGWSDWWSLMFTQKTSDTQSDAYPVGNYVLGQLPTGPGIRAYPYSFDMSKDPLTFNYYNSGGQEVHYSGTIWASALWDMNWLLINKYGFESNLYNNASSAGNIRALHLVMDALKVQPLNPSFVAARDALLLADSNLYGAANQCEIWTAFARRGLGQSASTSNSSSFSVATAFDVPVGACGLAVTSSTPSDGAVLIGNRPTDFVINFSNALNTSSVQPGDLRVNGAPASGVALSNGNMTATFSYAVSPVTAEGLQTMAIAADAMTRSLDNDGNDAFSAAFRFDAVAMQVVSTVPAVGSVLTLPVTTLDVNLNEPVNPASLQAGDLSLSQGTSVGSPQLLNGNTTIRFTLSGITDEGTLNAKIAAGKLTDTFGNPNLAFTASYGLDFGAVPYPVPLAAKNPAGSLVYDPVKSGVIGPAGDTDTFTISIEHPQTLSILVQPAAPGLFGVVGNGGINPGALLRIDDATGAGTVLGDGIAQGGLTGLAIDPSGIFFGSTIRNSTGSGLVRLNPLNGAILTNIGTITDGQGGQPIAIGDLAIQPGTGILYGVRSNGDGQGRGGELYRIDKTTAIASFVGNTNAGVGGGVAFAPDGSLYQTAYNNRFDFFSLNKLDPANAARISTVRLPTYFDGLGIRSDGTLFASQGGTGSAIYRIDPATGNTTFIGNTGVGSPSDLDFFTPPLLRPTVELRDGSNVVIASATASSAGKAAVIQTVPTTNTNAYSLTVFGANGTTGSYTVGVTLGAALEAESYDGPTNESKATAQNIDTSFIGLGGVGQRGAVLGRNELSTHQDWYAFTLEAGDTATLAVTALSSGSVKVKLVDSSSIDIALGAPRSTNTSSVINDFLATTDGTYYAVVSGTAGTDYNLIVTRNASFDCEKNDATVTAQALVSRQVAGAQQALGFVEAGEPATTIRFDELSPRPIDGVSLNGVAFDFKVNGVDSTDAVIGSNGPGVTRFTSPPQLLGNIRGILTLDFDTPTPQLHFGAVLSTTGTIANGVVVDLLNAGGDLIQTFPVTTTNQGFFWSEAQFDYVGSPVSRARLDFNESAGANQFALDNLRFGPQIARDLYQINAAAAAVIGVSTLTPGGGAGEPANNLDPVLRLLDPSGNAVASNDNGASDGRNAQLSYIVPAGQGGTYAVEVSSASPGINLGEYALRVIGASATAPPFRVQAANPADGTRFRSQPTTMTLDFNDVALLTSVAASDLRVDGVTVGDLSGNVGLYRVDVTLNAALETESHDGATNNTRASAQDLTQSFIGLSTSVASAQRSAVLGTMDAPLANNFAPVSGSLYHLGIKGTIAPNDDEDWFKLGELHAGDMLTISMSGSSSSRGTNPDTVLELYRGKGGSILAAHSDDDGPGSDSLIYRYYIGDTDTYFVRAAGFALATPGSYDLGISLENTGQAPATGGTITSEGTGQNNRATTADDISRSWRPVQYSSAADGSIATFGETDSYQFPLTAGDLVSIHVGPPYCCVYPHVTLRDPSGAVVASENGESNYYESPLYAFIVPANGTYTVEVSAAYYYYTGPYRVQVLLSTDTPPPPMPTAADFYSFTMAAGESATLALKSLSAGNVDLAVQDQFGGILATGSIGAANLSEVIGSFAAPATGTYYARITGDTDVKYSLLVTRSAAFDIEGNHSSPTAQNITGTNGVLGSLTPLDSGIVVPNNNANLEGNFDNGFPFNLAPFGVQSMRYQQVYASSQFPNGGVIDALRYRLDQYYGGPFASSNIDVKINLSYAARPSTNPSAVFAENVGAGVVTVFDGLLSLSGTGAGSVPKPFDVLVDIADTFNYDPSRGDLLVDIFMRSVSSTSFFDNQCYDPSSRRVYATSVTASTGTSDPCALVTRFDFVQPAPEDWYSIDVPAAGTKIRLETMTPGDGPGQFVNTVDPHIELYNPSGTLVAAGLVSVDGRNESITHVSATGGTYRVRVLGDNSSRGEYFLGLRELPPGTSNNRPSQAVQYSDPIAPIIIMARDIVSSSPSITTTWTVDGGRAQSGLPSGMSLSSRGCGIIDGSKVCTWMVSGAANVVPGIYVVTAAVADGAATRNTSFTVSVQKEDARASYTGVYVVSTTGPTSNTANVLLSATIQDITAVPGDPAFDGYSGDISKARVRFVDRETGQFISPALTPVLVDPFDPRTGTVSYNWIASIAGGSSGDNFDVGIVVDDASKAPSNYLRDSMLDDVVIDVFQPIGQFVTGGGQLVEQKSTGRFSADSGLKTNFGLNVKYNNNFSNLRGHVTIIVRKNEPDGLHVYQFKSTSIDSLTIPLDGDPNTGTAVFTAKANLNDIGSPGRPAPKAGNLSMKVTLTDNGEPGSSDTIGVTIYDAAGGLLFSSRWNGIQSVEQLLNGGNLMIHDANPLSVADGIALRDAEFPAVTDAALNSTIHQAIDEWRRTGISADRLALLSQAEVRVTDLAGPYLGLAYGSRTVLIDQNAAGHGWNLDNGIETYPTGIDLLTVVAHELGHLLGFEHSESNGLMAASLPASVRRSANISTGLASDLNHRSAQRILAMTGRAVSFGHSLEDTRVDLDLLRTEYGREFSSRLFESEPVSSIRPQWFGPVYRTRELVGELEAVAPVNEPIDLLLDEVSNVVDLLAPV